MSHRPFIVAAYAITWIVLGGYALYLELVVRRRARARLAAIGHGEGAR